MRRGEYEHAKAAGWIPHFIRCGILHGYAPNLLMAIASRETNMRNIVGDNGHGFGVMQVDLGTDRAFCVSGAWRDAGRAIERGAEILAEKREKLAGWEKAEGQIIYRTRNRKRWPFTPRPIESDADRLRINVAAYNAGMGAYYGFSKHGDPDYCTTGKDYSKDVLERARAFYALLAGDGFMES